MDIKGGGIFRRRFQAGGNAIEKNGLIEKGGIQ